MNGEAEANQCDRELARRAAAGDEAAFEELHRRYRRFVYAVALRMTGNTADAEDLAQESFIVLLRKLGSFRGEAALSFWLRRLTINQVLMHFRRRRSKPEQQPDEAMPADESRSASHNSELHALDRIAFERAVGALPPGYRATFILHDVEDYEHGEIARMMGCKAGTSKSQLHRARARLRELLSPQMPALQT